MAVEANPSVHPAEWYLDLLKRCLTRYDFGDGARAYEPARDSSAHALWQRLQAELDDPTVKLIRQSSFDRDARAEGRDWPSEAETMIGLRRLDSLQACVTRVLEDGVPGDLIETGVWRGGAAIFMRALLAAYADRDRIVWAADSFEGLPKPDEEQYPADADDRLWTWGVLAVSLEEVEENFRRYGLLDEQVRFLPGWFHETLPAAPIDELAVLRLDGDMYESTMVALEALYPKVSAGGYVIVDDYGAIEQCRRAVDDYRHAHGITAELEWVDWTGAFWRRPA
ncbi:MAG: macrocin O-methyltransferase [Actinobacteria bacterium QS_5_72_10]|nr:MAG: macrocin O-methyltransferase [Actinobacteria bacterium QS_5_72_10]